MLQAPQSNEAATSSARLPLPDGIAPLSRWARTALIAAPLACFGLILVATDYAAGHRALVFMLGMTAGSFFGGGKLIILAGAVEGAPVGMWPLAGLVVFGDIATACVMTAIIPIMYRIPSLGQRLTARRIHPSVRYALHPR